MFLRYNITGISWALIIMALTLVPGSSLPDLSFWELLSFDKVAHLIVFAILAFNLAVGFRKQHQFPALHIHALQYAFVISVIYGLTLEILQGALFADRYADLIDFIADTIGAGTGVFIFHLIFKNIYLR
ncbi:MAG: VanZ family protein [Bacteroidia bacterium]|nr:VanZ family protein [Bacteroidia bacterium]